jgi:uncharacterized protein (TIGR02421 family)
MAKNVPRARITSLLKESSEVFRFVSKRLKILSALEWDLSAANEFFQKKESQLPQPIYKIDSHALEEALTALKGLNGKLKGEHPVLKWLQASRESFTMGAQLLKEIGKPEFYQISTQLYGTASSRPFEGQISNAQLATSISERISFCNLNDIGEASELKSAEEFAAELSLRLQNRKPQMSVKVEISSDIVAKAIAGMNRVRIRRDARFSEIEVTALWNHEIESHCLTAHNGNIQENCNFLASGGPRTTLTQEGLAVFFEMYYHSFSQRRFLTLCDRVHGVEMAEKGANFIDVYRWYKERSVNQLDAFLFTQRIFRGADLNGKYPFTKDVVYLAGLLGVYNFLRIAVKNQNRILVESLVCGRIALEDVPILAWLRTHGFVDPPRFIPDWLKNWESLVSFFSFTGLLGNQDLSGFQNYFDSHSKLQDWDFSL